MLDSTIQISVAANQRTGAHAPLPGTQPGQGKGQGRHPRRSDPIVTLALLALCLVLAAPGMLVELHRPDAVDPAEAQAIVTARQTRAARSVMAAARPTDSAADTYPAGQATPPLSGTGLLSRLIPWLNGKPQLDQPPGITWTHLIALESAERWPGSQDPKYQVLATRLCSAAMGLLTVVGVFWAGYCIGGTRCAVYAGLVCAACGLCTWYARVATEPIHHAALATLSTAAALWAIRPLRPTPSVARQFLGWFLCGLSFGAALLTVGPVALLTIATPITLVLVLCPHRATHMLGLLAAIFIGALLVLPWALFLFEQRPEIWAVWWSRLAGEIDAPPGGFAAKQSAFLAIGIAALLPWAVWLCAAAVQSVSTSSKGSRTRMSLAWVWLLPVALTGVLIPSSDPLGSLLPAVAPAAVLIAFMFAQYAELADEGRYTRTWRWLRWPFFALLVVASLAIPAALQWQSEMIERGWIDHAWAETPGWVYAGGLCAALMIAVAWSLKWVLRGRPGKAMVCWAIWSLIVVAVLMIPVTRGPAMRNPLHDEARRLAGLVGDHPLFWVSPTPATTAGPPPALLLYSNRDMLSLTVGDLPGVGADGRPVYLLAVPGSLREHPSPRLITQLPATGRHLYRLDQPWASP